MEGNVISNIKVGNSTYVLRSLCTNIVYQDLVYARNNSELISGNYYRITDYITTTILDGTRSAGHQFDIIVRADASNILNEHAYAAYHTGDNYFKNKGAKLNAWKLLYSLDNDTSKYKWADPENGKGVIYGMIDEWGNDVHYDFKNILFYRDNSKVLKEATDSNDQITLADAAWNGLWDSKSGTYLTSPDGYYYTFTYISSSNEVKDLSFNLNEYYPYSKGLVCKLNYIHDGEDTGNTAVGEYTKYAGALTDNIFVLNEVGTTNARNVINNHLVFATNNTFGGRNVYMNNFNGGYCYNNVFGDGGYHARMYITGAFYNNIVMSNIDRLLSSGFINDNIIYKSLDGNGKTSTLINNYFLGNIANNIFKGTIETVHVLGTLNNNVFKNHLAVSHISQIKNCIFEQMCYRNTFNGMFEGNTINCVLSNSVINSNVSNTTFNCSGTALNYEIKSGISGKTVNLTPNAESTRILCLDSSGNVKDFTMSSLADLVS